MMSLFLLDRDGVVIVNRATNVKIAGDLKLKIPADQPVVLDQVADFPRRERVEVAHDTFSLRLAGFTRIDRSREAASELGIEASPEHLRRRPETEAHHRHGSQERDMERASFTIDVLPIFLLRGDRHHLLDALVETDPLGLIGEQLPRGDPGAVEGSILYRLGRAGHSIVVFGGKVRIARQLAIDAIAEHCIAIPKFLDGKRHELAVMIAARRSPLGT
jgi:hypothetical protein